MMTNEQLIALTDDLLSGRRDRSEVAKLADEDGWHPESGYCPAMIQPPWEQLYWMLRGAEAHRHPTEERNEFWYRDMDYSEAKAELLGEEFETELGNGWKQGRLFPEQARITWDCTWMPAATWGGLRRAGSSVFRMSSGPGWAERVLLRDAHGDFGYILQQYFPSSLKPFGTIVFGTGPMEFQLRSLLGAVEVDLGNKDILIRDYSSDMPQSVAIDVECHELWRLDDNDNEFRMGRYTTKAAAERVALHFEQKGHKQTYWVASETHQLRCGRQEPEGQNARP